MKTHQKRAATQARTRRQPLSTAQPVWFYFSNVPQGEFGYYGGAFHEAANTLMKSLRRRGFSNVAAAPVLFLYRHAIELYLKGIIVRGTRSIDATENDDLQLFASLKDHELLPLLGRVETILADADLEWSWPNNRSVETLGDVRSLITDIETIDRRSFSFRYPVTTRGKRSIATELEFNLEELAKALDALANALEIADDALSDRISP